VEAPPKRGIFFRLEVGISLVEVYERVERTLSLQYANGPKRPQSIFYGCENNKKLPGLLINHK